MTIVGKAIEPAVSQLTVTASPGENVNKNLQFYPLYAVVSNYTPYWMFFPSGGNFVPPFTVGAIVSLFHAVGGAFEWTSPFGDQTIIPDPSGITYRATVIFTNDPRLSPQGGSVVADPNTVTTRFFSYTNLVRVSVGDDSLLLDPVTNRSYRLLTYQVMLGGNPSFVPPKADSPVYFQFYTAPGGFFNFTGVVKPDSPLVFSAPNVDLPVNEGLRVAASTNWADSSYNINLSYQVF